MADMTAPTTANPFGLTPSTQAFMQGLQGLSSTLNAGQPGGTGGANYMRPAGGMAFNQGSPAQAGQLLQMLIQMRANQAAALGAPFQQGTRLPAVSLLNG